MDRRVAERFGRNLWRQRRLADLTQEELGALTDLHRVDIGKMERGLQVPRLDTILKLCGGVDASPCELLAGLRWRAGRYVEGDFYVEDGPKPSPRARRDEE